MREVPGECEMTGAIKGVAVARGYLASSECLGAGRGGRLRHTVISLAARPAEPIEYLRLSQSL